MRSGKTKAMMELAQKSGKGCIVAVHSAEHAERLKREYPGEYKTVTPEEAANSASRFDLLGDHLKKYGDK